MSRRRRSDYRLSLGWILGVTFIGTLTRLKLPQWSSLSFGAAVCLRLPPHTTSQRKLSRLATDHATCSCLRLTVATNSPRKGLSPPIQCPCRAHQYKTTNRPPSSLSGQFLSPNLYMIICGCLSEFRQRFMRDKVQMNRKQKHTGQTARAAGTETSNLELAEAKHAVLSHGWFADQDSDFQAALLDKASLRRIFWCGCWCRRSKGAATRRRSQARSHCTQGGLVRIRCASKPQASCIGIRGYRTHHSSGDFVSRHRSIGSVEP